jgi:hypothetical protein
LHYLEAEFPERSGNEIELWTGPPTEHRTNIGHPEPEIDQVAEAGPSFLNGTLDEVIENL